MPVIIFQAYPPTLNHLTLMDWMNYKNAIAEFTMHMPDYTKKFYLISGLPGNFINWQDISYLNDINMSFNIVCSKLEERILEKSPQFRRRRHYLTQRQQK